MIEDLALALFSGAWLGLGHNNSVLIGDTVGSVIVILKSTNWRMAQQFPIVEPGSIEKILLSSNRGLILIVSLLLLL